MCIAWLRRSVLLQPEINHFSMTFVCAWQAAKKMDPSFLMRYAIFTREQQHTQKSADGAGGKSSSRAAATDLVSYVEFQRNYRYVMHGCVAILGL
jgi:hypothetical protein